MYRLGDIYHSIPRFCGDAFRATKVPAILLSAALVGCALIAVAFELAVTISDSNLPGHIFVIGMFQTMANPKMPPELLRVMQTMTPGQLALARYLAYFIMFDAAVIVISFPWWVARFCKFLIHRANGPQH